MTIKGEWLLKRVTAQEFYCKCIHFFLQTTTTIATIASTSTLTSISYASLESSLMVYRTIVINVASAFTCECRVGFVGALCGITGPVVSLQKKFIVYISCFTSCFYLCDSITSVLAKNLFSLFIRM